MQGEEDLAAALDVLTRAELLYEQALYPQAEYAFKHPLTQEVAYRTQLSERRVKVHAAVARAVADDGRERLDERAAVLAYHWEAAGEALDAARWHRRAAAWVGVSDAREALRHWEKVRTLLGPLPASAEVATLGLEARNGILNFGWRLGMSAGDADRVLQEGRVFAARMNDPGALVRMLLYHAATRGFAGDMAEYHARVREAAALAERIEDDKLEIRVTILIAYGHYLSGKTGEALRALERGIELSRSDPRGGTENAGFASYPWFLGNRANLLADIGRFAEAQREHQRAEEVARSVGVVENVVWAGVGSAYLASIQGDERTALEEASRAVQLAETTGTSLNRCLAQLGLGMAQVGARQPREALVALERGLAIARESRVGLIFEARFLATLGEAYLDLGDHDRACAATEEAIAAAERLGTRVWAIDAYVSRARVLLRSHGAAARPAVEDAIARAAALIDETGARLRQPWLHIVRAKLARLGGDEAGRRRDLGEAQRLFTEMGVAARAEQVARALADRPVQAIG